jgi:NitT/TauT family transport system ATP-binding protein
MSEIVLQVSQLTKQYQSRQGPISALRDISFSLASGEFVCVVGPSGCGKSTLLRLMAGLLEPDQGRVCLHGQPLTAPSRDISLVFQKANLMPWRTVFDNVLLPLQVQHFSRDEAEPRVARALELVGLLEVRESYPHEMSGGMAQRVALARALAHEPEVLLLDEPFGALDALTRERLNQDLLRIWETDRRSVVMVTHNIREAVYLADRVLVLTQRPGRLAATIPVPLPHPRPISLIYDSEPFNALAYQVRQAIQ